MSSTILSHPSPARRRLRGMAAILVSAGLMLTAAACGSDDGDETSSDDGGSQSEADAPADDEQDAGQDDAAEDEAGEASGEYCDQLSQIGEDLMSSSATAATDPDAAADLSSTIRQIAEAAPDDVAGDWNTMADAMEALADIDMTDPDAADDLEQLSSDLTAASQRLSEHTMTACS